MECNTEESYDKAVASALTAAAKEDDTDKLKCYLDNGIDIRLNKDAALKVAAVNRNMDTVRYILSLGIYDTHNVREVIILLNMLLMDDIAMDILDILTDTNPEGGTYEC